MALIFIIGVLFSTVVGLGAVILDTDIAPVAPAVRTCCVAFGASMVLWIAAMALWKS